MPANLRINNNLFLFLFNFLLVLPLTFSPLVLAYVPDVGPGKCVGGCEAYDGSGSSSSSGYSGGGYSGNSYDAMAIGAFGTMMNYFVQSAMTASQPSPQEIAYQQQQAEEQRVQAELARAQQERLQEEKRQKQESLRQEYAGKMQNSSNAIHAGIKRLESFLDQEFGEDLEAAPAMNWDGGKEQMPSNGVASEIPSALTSLEEFSDPNVVDLHDKTFLSVNPEVPKAGGYASPDDLSVTLEQKSAAAQTVEVKPEMTDAEKAEIRKRWDAAAEANLERMRQETVTEEIRESAIERIKKEATDHQNPEAIVAQAHEDFEKSMEADPELKRIVTKNRQLWKEAEEEYDARQKNIVKTPRAPSSSPDETKELSLLDSLPATRPWPGPKNPRSLTQTLPQNEIDRFGEVAEIFQLKEWEQDANEVLEDFKKIQ